MTVTVDEFEAFVISVEPRLRRALAGHVRLETVADATSEAFAYAWQHWQRVSAMENPTGYLFRVAQSRSRTRRDGALPAPAPAVAPHVEPRLVDAMRALPSRQRSAVWLVHGCNWTYAEVAAALDISASAVGTHVARGMAALRSRLGADVHE